MLSSPFPTLVDDTDRCIPVSRGVSHCAPQPGTCSRLDERYLRHIIGRVCTYGTESSASHPAHCIACAAQSDPPGRLPRQPSDQPPSLGHRSLAVPCAYSAEPLLRICFAAATPANETIQRPSTDQRPACPACRHLPAALLLSCGHTAPAAPRVTAPSHQSRKDGRTPATQVWRTWCTCRAPAHRITPGPTFGPDSNLWFALSYHTVMHCNALFRPACTRTPMRQLVMEPL